MPPGRTLCRKMISSFHSRDRHVEIVHPRQALGQRGQLVVVGGEEHLGAAPALVQLLGHRPRDREAVEGGGAAPDLVQENQAARGGVVQDAGRLHHLHQERALPARHVVLRAHAREDAVHQPEPGRAGGDEARPSGP